MLLGPTTIEVAGELGKALGLLPVCNVPLLMTVSPE